jgi:aspartate carbamoyltransferase regulatory subunit
MIGLYRNYLYLSSYKNTKLILKLDLKMSEDEELVKISARLPKSIVAFIDKKASVFNPKLNRQQMVEHIIRKFKEDSDNAEM